MICLYVFALFESLGVGLEVGGDECIYVGG